MAREDRDYQEGPVQVEVGREDKQAAAEDAAAESRAEKSTDRGADAAAEADADAEEDDFVPVERPETERDRIAREYSERLAAKQAEASPVEMATEAAKPADNEPEVEVEPEQVEVKIDGQTYMVDAKTVEEAGGIRAYQKEQAADKRFRELAAQQQAFQEQVRRFNEQVATAPPQTKTDPSPEDGPDKEDLAKKALQAMYDGDEDQAAQYLVDLTRRDAGQPAINPQEVIQEAARVMAQNQYQRDVAEGKEDFLTNYPEIAKNPTLWAQANQMTGSISKEHPNWRPQRVMDEAGKRVMAAEKAKAAAANGTRQEKLAAKRAQTNVGQTTGRGKPTPPPKYQSDSDYVKSLLKQRGLGAE